MARVTGLEPATSGVTGRRSNQLSYTRANHAAQAGGDPPDLPGPGTTMHRVARVTGLEPATSGVTGRRSNQLSYTRSYQACTHAVRPGAHPIYSNAFLAIATIREGWRE